VKASIIVGAIGGFVYSLFNLYAMLTPLTYSKWDAINNWIFVAEMLALLGLAALLMRRSHSLLATFKGVAIASALMSGLFLLTYWVSTAFYAHRLVQLPFFLKDYTYHGYESPQQYLTTGNNYDELMLLMLFSASITVIIQIVLSGIVAILWREAEKRFLPQPSD
jgi:hypothetical protein